MKIFLQILNSAGRAGRRRNFMVKVLCAILLLLPASASAAPAVAVSIKPLHSLVAAVMDGVGMPVLIVQGAGSEHGYQLRPDDAKALAASDIVFWAGPGMETFLVKPLANLAPRAVIVALADVPGVELLKMRDGGNFEAHHHDHEHSAHAEHGHQDLHFWLDPHNVAAAVRAIAVTLAEKDPANARHYHSNAKMVQQGLMQLTQQVRSQLAPYRGRPFIVFHDAYQYFERRFDIPAAGSVTVSPEQAPGVRRISEIRNKVKQLGSVCVFSEPQFEPRVVTTVIAGTGARTGVLDPLGADIAPGPDQYPALIHQLADSLVHCLADIKQP